MWLRLVWRPQLLSAYLLFAVFSLLTYLLVVIAAAVCRHRRLCPQAPLLPLHERAYFESCAIEVFGQRNASDGRLRRQFLEDCLGANQWLQQRIDQSGTQADAHLHKFVVQFVRQLDDQVLWRFLELLAVPIDSQPLQQRRQSYQQFDSWCLSSQAAAMFVGLVALLTMLLLPPWLHQREHRIRVVHGPREHTVLERRSLGYQPILVNRPRHDQIRAIPTGDLQRFEEEAVRTTVNYTRLAIQCVGLTLLVVGFVWSERQVVEVVRLP
jgi:hypothetical protein